MDAPRIFPLKVIGDMWQQALVDIIGDERCERCEALDKSEKNLEEGVESMFGIIETKFAL